MALSSLSSLVEFKISERGYDSRAIAEEEEEGEEVGVEEQEKRGGGTLKSEQERARGRKPRRTERVSLER